MDRRNWPWKKKSSEKTASAYSASSLSDICVKQQEEKEHKKPVSFAQISIEKYEYLNGLEEQVELLKEQLSFTKENLFTAQAETKTKDELVKQHAKVAEEAISGWEKAEAEALALKHDLESVTLLKLGAEERVAHLDGALKECMKQVRNVKEESELKLHEVVLAKTKQWEKVKAELESTISSFEQELIKCSGETALLSRSLQERSLSLMKIGEDKARADAEIEVLKTNIQSREKEANSLKYELNIAAKELEIRNEEKNMSVKSAEVANKQHTEDVKKITKLEAECQRLRGLVRKKLPGPAALAQMKQEVESLDQGFRESRMRQSGKNSSPYPLFAPEAMLNEVEQYRQEHEFLASRLLAMEEETKMLKEALAKRNTELQVSRSTCAKTANRLRSLEAQILAMNHQKSPSKSNAGVSLGGSLSQNESNQSLASMSEDGIDDQGSCVESWASALVSELSQIKKEKNSDISQIIAHNTNQLELMDDFLEMERLASLSSDNNGVVSGPSEWAEKVKENCDESSSFDVHIDVCKEQIPALIKLQNVDLQTDNQCSGNLLSKLEMRIASVIESKFPNGQKGKLLEEIMAIVQDVPYDSPHHSKDLGGEGQCRVGEAPHSEASLNQDGNLCRQPEINTNEELTSAVSWIHDFVISFYKEAIQTKPFEVQATRERVEEFSDSMCKLLSNKLNLDGFVVALFHILAEIIELRSKPWDMGENNSVACIDKVTLLENGIAPHHPIEGNLSGVQSNTDAFGGPTNGSAELKDASQSFAMEEFEHVKLEKDNLEANLAKCRETLGNTKLQLTETEQHLAALKLQLSACQKSNVLAETQLRCMTESYKCLESRVEQLESELSLLKSKAETLESELNVERHNHQEDVSKYTELQEQMRSMHCLKCSSHSYPDADFKARQEREIAAAAEKLAACQETIVLLNKQLTALCPTAEPMSMSSRFVEEVKMDSFNSQSSQFSSFGDYATEISPREGIESPPHEYSSQVSTSDMELNTTPKKTANSKRPKHRSKSPSASSLSSLLNEKQERVFSRFFVKGKTEI